MNCESAMFDLKFIFAQNITHIMDAVHIWVLAMKAGIQCEEKQT